MFGLIAIAFVLGIVQVSSLQIDNTVLCFHLNCSFDEGHSCAFRSTNGTSKDPDPSKHGKPAPQFTPQFGRLGDLDNGVPRASSESQGFMGALLDPGETAILWGPDNLEIPGRRIVKFDYYAASPGVVVKGCYSSLTQQCIVAGKSFTPNPDADADWHHAKFDLPKGKVHAGILVVNNGKDQAAVGIDQVELFDGDGKTPACRQGVDRNPKPKKP